MKRSIILLISAFFFCSVASAEEIEISPTTSLQFSVPTGWLLADKPPMNLLEEMAEHISHEAAAKGHSPSKDQLLSAARKRLAENEVILYNPKTISHLTLDFSPLRQGERAPSEKSIKLSAKYAGESLEQEEGVSQHSGKTYETSVDGAWYAYRYDASYLHHDEKMAFSGVIGFKEPYWFFFYYTDYMQDPADRERLEQVLKSIKIIKK